MININSELNNISQLDFARQNNVGTPVSTSAAQSKATEQDENATKVTLSDSVKNSVNNTMSREDTLVQKLNIAKTIYNSLGDIRLELSGLINELTGSDVQHNIDSLTDLDNKSNTLIDKAISVVKDNDTIGLVSSKILNNYFENLATLKTLDYTNDNHFTKLEGLLNNLLQRQSDYSTVVEESEEELAEINEEYENQVSETKVDDKNTDSSQIQKLIIETFGSTLTSSTKNLNPQVVLRLLQGI